MVSQVVTKPIKEEGRNFIVDARFVELKKLDMLKWDQPPKLDLVKEKLRESQKTS